jgi:hypothetical protein
MIFPNPVRFLATIGRTFWARLAGYRVLLTPEEQDNRLVACEVCEELTESRQCRVCTCFVDAKTALAPERCPLGRWPAIWVKKNRPELQKNCTV